MENKKVLGGIEMKSKLEYFIFRDKGEVKLYIYERALARLASEPQRRKN